MMARSERRAWRVAGSSITVALSAVLAVVAHGPLQKVIEVPIVVDKQTGETTIQQRLAIETVPHLDTLDKHNAAAFVRAREGYSWWWLQRDFDQVARMAVPAVFADYNRQFEGEAALQKKLSATEEWRVNVISVRLSAAKRQGNRGEATVTYEKSVRLTDRNLPDTVTRHVATLVYEYQPKALAKEKDRIENPFGFVVIAYRSDPEISTATPAAPGKV
jgi:type IV secretion system protein VirB8